MTHLCCIFSKLSCYCHLEIVNMHRHSHQASTMCLHLLKPRMALYHFTGSVMHFCILLCGMHLRIYCHETSGCCTDRAIVNCKTRTACRDVSCRQDMTWKELQPCLLPLASSEHATAAQTGKAKRKLRPAAATDKGKLKSKDFAKGCSRTAEPAGVHTASPSPMSSAERRSPVQEAELANESCRGDTTFPARPNTGTANVLLNAGYNGVCVFGSQQPLGIRSCCPVRAPGFCLVHKLKVCYAKIVICAWKTRALGHPEQQPSVVVLLVHALEVLLKPAMCVCVCQATALGQLEPAQRSPCWCWEACTLGSSKPTQPSLPRLACLASLTGNVHGEPCSGLCCGSCTQRLKDEHTHVCRSCALHLAV